MTEIPIEAQIKPFIFLILLICFLSLNIIYAKTNENLGNKREINAFKGMLVSFMIYVIEDSRLLYTFVIIFILFRTSFRSAHSPL